MVSLIAEGADVSRVAEATTHAWQLAFAKARNDAGFKEAVWLLAQLGVAGRSAHPVKVLRAVGLDLGGSGSVVEMAMALSAAMDRRAKGSRERSDFGELACRALIGSVTEHMQWQMADGKEGMDVRVEVRRFGREFEQLFGGFSRG